MPESKRRGLDELNVVRLNLIAALDQVTHAHWKVELRLDDRTVQVECEALERYGVPHGLDNDVTAAILAEYVASGMPEDGRVTVSVTRLRDLSGFGKGGRYLGLLRESLNRLATTTYTVSEGGWQDPNRRWTHAKFHYLKELEFTTADGAGAFDERSLVSLQLASQIAASVRGGYTKPLDVDFMLGLNRPRARVLYRVLDAARYDHASGLKLDEFTKSLDELVSLLKIPGDRPDNVRRALTPAHEELRAKGYLRNVTLTGRGITAKIHYEFVPNFQALDPKLIERLRGYEIADGVARKLVQDHSRDWLISQMTRFDALVSTGALVPRKSRAAALMHLLRNPDDYPYPKVEPRRAKPSRMDPMLTLEPTDVGARYLTMSPEQAADAIVKDLRLYFRQKLSLSHLEMLRTAVLEDRINPAEVVREAVAAVAQLKQDEFIMSLRTRLSG